MKKFRAVFVHPSSNQESESHGPERDSLGEALRDRPHRSEETFAYLVGVEHRELPPWQAVSLRDIVAEVKGIL